MRPKRPAPHLVAILWLAASMWMLAGPASARTHPEICNETVLDAVLQQLEWTQDDQLFRGLVDVLVQAGCEGRVEVQVAGTLPAPPSVPSGCGVVGHAQDGAAFVVCATPRKWFDARSSCLRMGGDLASIHSADEQATLFAGRALAANLPFWLGLNDRTSEGRFLWKDGTPAGYTHWNVGEPNNFFGGEDCVHMWSDSGRWNDAPCGSPRPYACRLPIEWGNSRDGGPARVHGGMSRTATALALGCSAVGQSDDGDDLVLCANPLNWLDARASCQQMDGDLASIRSEREQRTLYVGRAAAGNRPYWIGLNDQRAEGRFEWKDGARTRYTNWNGGEPNDFHTGEDCVHVWSDGGRWNDLACGHAIPYACRLPALEGLAHQAPLGRVPADVRLPHQLLIPESAPAPSNTYEIVAEGPPSREVGQEAPPTVATFTEESSGGTSAVDGDFEKVEWAVLERVNQIRLERGLAKLTYDARLQAGAINHSVEMYQRRYFSHTSPVAEHADFATRITLEGIDDFGEAGENLLMGPDAGNLTQRIVDIWMDSPGHRENILGENFRFSGVGVYGEGQRVYTTQLFAQRVERSGE